MRSAAQTVGRLPDGPGTADVLDALCGPVANFYPFSPPDRDRRVDSPAWSARGSDLPGAPQDEAGLTRKFET